MNRVRPERELYRILQQPGQLDGDGRARPDAFRKIRQLVQASADFGSPGALLMP